MDGLDTLNLPTVDDAASAAAEDCRASSRPFLPPDFLRDLPMINPAFAAAIVIQPLATYMQIYDTIMHGNDTPRQL